MKAARKKRMVFSNPTAFLNAVKSYAPWALRRNLRIYPFAAARIIESNFFMASTFFYLVKDLLGKHFFCQKKGFPIPKERHCEEVLFSKMWI